MNAEIPEQGSGAEAPEPESSTDLNGLIERMAKAVVDYSDFVSVDQVEGPTLTVFKLTVASDDMGRVIGRQGRIANSMRIILRAAAAKEGKRVSLDIESRRLSGDELSDANKES